MKIEKIEKLNRQQEQILVHLEGGDTLRITGNELLHFGLYPGLDIDRETVVELTRYAAASHTRARAAALISARPLSRAELCRRLTEKGATAEDAEAAADYLERIGALDDAAYAAMLVRHLSAKGYGAGRIRDEFFRRGIPRELWDDALAAAPDTQERIEAILAAKIHGKPLDDRERKRLADMLLRRGFSRSEVYSAIRALGAQIEYEDD